MVLRIDLDLFTTDVGGRRRALQDGYRASMSFGRRRRGIEPIVHDELPRDLAEGTVFTLLEGDRLVARAEVLGVYDDPAPFPVRDLAAAKTRRLQARAA